MAEGYITRKGGGGGSEPEIIVQTKNNSKWKITNVVDFQNNAGNQTFSFLQFGWVQPAFNSKTPPTFTNANIDTTVVSQFFNTTGNVRIFRVNEYNAVELNQTYIRDFNGQTYSYHNGFSSPGSPNPNPAINTPGTGLRWYLNNNPHGKLVFDNVVLSSAGTTTTPNILSVNEAAMQSAGQYFTLDGRIRRVWELNKTEQNIYIGGDSGVAVFGYNNAGGQSVSAYIGFARSFFAINNGFIYIGGSNNNLLKYHQNNGNLVSSLIVNSYFAAGIRKIIINNGSIFVTEGRGDGTNGGIVKINESSFSIQSQAYGIGQVGTGVWLNNGFLYVNVDNPVGRVRKFSETTLSLVSESAQFISLIQGWGIAGTSNFVFVAANNRVVKLHENNLSLISNFANTTVSEIHRGVYANNGLVYAANPSSTTSSRINVGKYNAETTALIGTINANTNTQTYYADENYIFVGGFDAEPFNGVRRYTYNTTVYESINLFSIQRIKE